MHAGLRGRALSSPVPALLRRQYKRTLREVDQIRRAAIDASRTSALVTKMTLEPLSQIGDVARSLGRGLREPRLLWSYGDERDATAVAVNRMADVLTHEIDDARRDALQLEAVMGGMVEGVLVLDLSEHIRLVNHGFRELFDHCGPWLCQLLPQPLRL